VVAIAQTAAIASFEVIASFVNAIRFAATKANHSAVPLLASAMWYIRGECG
jgi:hypothetical protein